MPGNIFWQSGGAVVSWALQQSGQGPQLANGAAVQVSGDFFNNGASGQPAFYVTAELVLSQSGYAAAVKSQQTVDLYLVPSRDGTNFPTLDVTNASLPLDTYVGSFATTTSGQTTRERYVKASIPVLPLRYRPYLVNNVGQTMMSGWSFNLDGYDEAYT